MKLIDMDKLIFDLEEKINDGYICTSDELFETIKSMPIERNIGCNWIPCSEQLPEPEDISLKQIVIDKGNGLWDYRYGWYRSSHKEWIPFTKYPVIAWKDFESYEGNK